MIFEDKTKLRRALLASTVIAGFGTVAAFNTAVMAQDADDDDAIEEVVVTGSRIARSDFTSTSPIATIGAEEFSLSGSVNVEQVLAQLPQTIPGFGGSSNNPGNGTATVNLRGLGAGRTMVLVNGRRWVGYTTGGIVDLNTIPAAMIERVEVVTGGASAVYGSDAMAGVVNFIMKRDFEGVEISAQFDTTSESDGERYTVDMLVGGNFADGRGNATFHAGYLNRTPLFQGDRPGTATDLWDWCIVPGTEDPVTGVGTMDLSCDPATTSPGWIQGGSTTIPEGRVGSTRFNPDGSTAPFAFPVGIYNYAPVNYLQLPMERWTFTAASRYEINDLVEVYVEGTYIDTRVPTQLAPTPAGLGGAVIDIDSPFLSAAGTPNSGQDWAAALEDPANLGYTTPVIFRRRMAEVGPRQEDNTRNAYRIMVGATGEFSEGWTYDLNFLRTRLSGGRVLKNDVNANRYRQALATELDGDGNLVCAASADAGCAPINVFGLGNVSEEAADFIRLSALDRTWIVTQAVQGTVSGNVSNPLGADDIGIAFGFEYRKQESDYSPDQNLIDDNVLGFNNAAAVGGAITSKEVFVEFLVPVFNDMAGMKSLELSLAGRYSDYSTVGGVYSYAGGLTWQPVDDVMVRAQYQRAVRAPNIAELFAGQTNGFPSATDPCAAGGTAPAALCVATGTGGFEFTFPSNNQQEGLFGGNPNLGEESSDTYTVGAVFTPTMLPGFTATVDYYSIQIDDFISVLGGGVANTLELCYFTLADAGSIYCQAINRLPDGTIDFVEVTNANVSRLKTQGIDLNFNYSQELGFGIFEDSSTVSLAFLGTYVIQNEIWPIQEDPTESDPCAGLFGRTCGEPDPKYRFNVRVNWETGPLTVSLQYRWMDSVVDDRVALDGWTVGSSETANGSDLGHLGLGSRQYVDLSFRYDVNDTLTLSAGARNLFNTKAPLTGDYDEQANTFPETYDAIGTRYFFSVNAAF
jgi:outer membrane receptor protein involved in Fe transport